MGNRIDDRLPPDVKNSLWVARNYKQVFIASVSVAVLSLIGTFITVNRQAGVIQEQSQVIKNMANKVVFVRADGKVVQLEKETLGGSTVQYALRDIVVNYVPVSAFDIKNANMSKFEEFTKLYKVKRMLKYLTEDGLRGYRAYLERVYSSYNNATLPEVVNVLSIEGIRDNIKYQNNLFEYTADFPVDLMFVQNQRWVNAAGAVSVRITGKVDMASSTPENPLGIMIEKFEVINYVSKP